MSTYGCICAETGHRGGLVEGWVDPVWVTGEPRDFVRILPVVQGAFGPNVFSEPCRFPPASTPIPTPELATPVPAPAVDYALPPATMGSYARRIAGMVNWHISRAPGDTLTARGVKVDNPFDEDIKVG